MNKNSHKDHIIQRVEYDLVYFVCMHKYSTNDYLATKYRIGTGRSNFTNGTNYRIIKYLFLYCVITVFFSPKIENPTELDK